MKITLENREEIYQAVWSELEAEADEIDKFSQYNAHEKCLALYNACDLLRDYALNFNTREEYKADLESDS